jgi:quercetin dioxygenase-like cupin family protein
MVVEYGTEDGRMTLIHRGQARRTETPNAVMTTLASPTLGGAERSLWRVDMAPGQSGPPHRFDAQQIWTALSGAATVELEDVPYVVEAGDTIVIPAHQPRRILADPAAGFSAIVTAAAQARAAMADGTDRGIPDWIS